MESLSKHRPRLSTIGVFVALLVRLRLSSAGDCPADGRTWVPSGGSCYHFVHGEEDKVKSYTFERAQSFCQGFELVTIQSKEENDFILKYSPEVWKGNTNVWLGMYYDTNSDELKWFGEKDLSYTNWQTVSSAASELAPMEMCVTMHSSTGKWENVSCVDQLENGVICETSQKPSVVLSVLLVLSVVAIMVISAVIWFLHQKRNPGMTIFTPFEYHPSFGGASHGDRSYLVEVGEMP
ncbi:CD302 antigen [Merluccius polli]|uniref:CD302 antigen n=1 Tax=Merluccius polli TaxID=89951 RepID=A0AA47P2Z2_MERPO|nr:CD302 antigen [Merluccius polli]